MNLDAIFVRSPINRLAATVTSQRRVAVQDEPLSREELAYIVQRLTRKLRLLKEVLGIKSKAQHRNLVWKTNKGIRNYRAEKEPRAVIEYKRVGEEIQRMNAELAILRKCRQAAAKQEAFAKQSGAAPAHPGEGGSS